MQGSPRGDYRTEKMCPGLLLKGPGPPLIRPPASSNFHCTSSFPGPLNPSRFLLRLCLHSIIEAMGLPVRITPGSYTNIKVTTPDDMSVADKFLDEHDGGASKVAAAAV